MAGNDTLEYRWLGPLALIVLILFGGAQFAGISAGVAATAIIADYAFALLLIAPWIVLLLVTGFLFDSAVNRRSPIADLVSFFKSRLRSRELAAAMLVPLLLTPVVMGSFGTLKMLMPIYRDFVWDDVFAKADRIMFLGWQPWEITHALFGGAMATQVIDVFYSLWIFTLFIAVFVAMIVDREARARFFLSFGAAWLLLGICGGYLFASAGPCFAAIIGAESADDFAPLMDRLHAIAAGGTHLGAVEWQSQLWNAHANRNYRFAMGISAMPSMHIAITMLYVLALGRASRVWRISSRIFFAVIFIGSVHLGWHYASDGIVAAAAMAGIWWCAGAYLRNCGYASASAALAQSEPPTGPAIPGVAISC